MRVHLSCKSGLWHPNPAKGMFPSASVESILPSTSVLFSLLLGQTVEFERGLGSLVFMVCFCFCFFSPQTVPGQQQFPSPPLTHAPQGQQLIITSEFVTMKSHAPINPAHDSQIIGVLQRWGYLTASENLCASMA